MNSLWWLFGRPRNARLSRANLEFRVTPRERLRFVAVGMTATLGLSLFLGAYHPPLLQRLVNSVNDFQLKMLSESVPSPVPLVVAIDERSLAELGQWPWPRHLVAKLLAKLRALDVAAVGVDAIFPEKDRTSPAEVQRELKQRLGSSFSLAAVPERLRDNDQLLARTLAKGPFVMSYYFDYQDGASRDCRPRAAAVAVRLPPGSGGGLDLDQEAKGVTCSITPLAEAASAGFINAQPDNDGVYRRTPLLIEYEGRLFPSLALQTLMTAEGVRQLLVEPKPGGLTLRLENQAIPLDDAGNLLIRFRGPRSTFEHISAVDVLFDRVDARRIRDRIALLGVSGTGLKEYRPTPLDPLFSGVELHAAILDNILQGDFLQQNAVTRGLELGALFLIGVGVSLLLASAGPLVIAVLSPLSLIAIGIASQSMLATTGMLISPVPSFLGVMLVLFLVSLYKYWVEQRRSLEIMRQIQLSQEAAIEGFGAMAEYRDPETGGHIKRTQNYIKVLAERLRDHPKFAPCLNDVTIELMHKTAPLHDIGKIAVPDQVLLKNGPLTESEFERMKDHTVLGAAVIDVIESKSGKNPFFGIAREIIFSHQEKWDGTGYPRNLAGEQIPVAARLMAVGDVYDALISPRVYKRPCSHKTAVRIIQAESGTHFDPDVVDAFVDIEEKFLDIALEFLDNEAQREVLLSEDTGVPRIDRIDELVHNPNCK